jgi:hypothetical protein
MEKKCHDCGRHFWTLHEVDGVELCWVCATVREEDRTSIDTIQVDFGWDTSILDKKPNPEDFYNEVLGRFADQPPPDEILTIQPVPGGPKFEVTAADLAKVNQELHDKHIEALKKSDCVKVEDVDLYYKRPPWHLEGHAADLTLYDEHEYVECVPEYGAMVDEED